MSLPNILVVGYYGHYNLGDEQYKRSISHVLNKAVACGFGSAVTYVDCDQIFNATVDQDTILVLGGGDVLNHYFLDKLNEFVKRQQETCGFSPRCIAFSVGVPYNDVFIQREHAWKLGILEHVFLRTQQDIATLERYIGEYGLRTRVHYLPDVSCMLSDTLYCDTPVTYPRRTIGIMLSRCVHNTKTSKSTVKYNNITYEFSRLIDHLVSLNFNVILVPFNTNFQNDNENDILIQRDVYNKLRFQTRRAVKMIETTLTIGEMMTLFKSFYMTIPMRFHATLFSVYCQIPMIPVFCTKKIRNFLLDIQWDFYYLMEKDGYDVPIGMNHYDILKTFRNLVQTKKYLEMKRKMLTISNYMRANVEHKYDTIRDVLTDGAPATKEPVETPAVETPIEDPYQDLIKRLNEIAQDHGYLEGFQSVADQEIQSLIVSVVSHALTGSIDSSYNYGLMEKMFQSGYKYQEEWKWIIANHGGQQPPKESVLVPVPTPAPPARADPPPPMILSSPYVSQPERKRLNIMFKEFDDQESQEASAVPIMPKVPSFNIHYIDQNDRSGAHRSGWKFVYDNIKKFNDPESPVLLDLYVDRTFHWKREIYKHLGVIPYRKPWFGVIHHTFDTTFSDYNNTVLLKCPEFVESLATCRGLIVLSKYLRGQFLEYATTNSVPRPIAIFVATHPTDVKVPLFDYSQFCANRDKKLIHIGGWLRNIFSFYRLGVSTVSMSPKERAAVGVDIGCCVGWFRTRAAVATVEPEPIRRVILKGRNMNNYFPPQDWEGIQMVDRILPKPEGEAMEAAGTVADLPEDTDPVKYCSQSKISIPPTRSNWLKHAMLYMTSLAQDPSIEILEHVENQVYDELLTKNLVFIHLVDGSAINTVLECFVRNTPLLVNRHPAVEEVLGQNYPLFYQDATTESVQALLCADRIRAAHLHMLNMPKTAYQIETFRDKLFRILETASVSTSA